MDTYLNGLSFTVALCFSAFCCVATGYRLAMHRVLDLGIETHEATRTIDEAILTLHRGSRLWMWFAVAAATVGLVVNLAAR